MGLFDRFGKKFDDRVTEAVTAVKAMNLGVTNLAATVRGKVVTLTGEAPSRDVATAVMQKIDELAAPDNIVNAIKVTAPKPEPAPAPDEASEPPTERYHIVVAGDTLGHIAQKYYGKASAYMKIFEANRDILDDPNLIKVGQKLKIPQ